MSLVPPARKSDAMLRHHKKSFFPQNRFFLPWRKFRCHWQSVWLCKCEPQDDPNTTDSRLIVCNQTHTWDDSHICDAHTLPAWSSSSCAWLLPKTRAPHVLERCVVIVVHHMRIQFGKHHDQHRNRWCKKRNKSFFWAVNVCTFVKVRKSASDAATRQYC